ncbi:MAG TPA: hypothetical protein VK184_10335 [Nostocaceae cyanobacterium]|nr:hypothetical protein [Nostocaceae cyanobacterium]
MFLSRESLFTPVVFLVCIIAVSLLQLPRMHKLLASKQDIPQATLEKDIEKENIRLNFLESMPSFGYDNLLADWVYIDYLQYFGDDEVRVRTGYNLSPEYFEVILKNDPRFLDAYFSLSVSTSLYAGLPEKSIALMEKGLKFIQPKNPEKSYVVWRYKATDELLFLGDSQAAQTSFRKTAEWANQYNDEESKNIAAISQGTAEFLKKNPDSRYVRIATWALVLNNTTDEKTRKRAIKEIEALGGQVVINPDGSRAIKLPEKD